MDDWTDFTRLVQREPPQEGFITTFNLWTALTNWKGSTPLPPPHKMSAIQLFMYLMNAAPKGLKIIVTPPSDIQETRITSEARLLYGLMKKVTFKIHRHNHAKLIALDYGDNKWRIWNSSRNFHGTCTEILHEITTEVVRQEEIKKCKRLIKILMKESEPLP